MVAHVMFKVFDEFAANRTGGICRFHFLRILTEKQNGSLRLHSESKELQIWISWKISYGKHVCKYFLGLFSNYPRPKPKNMVKKVISFFTGKIFP